MAKPLGSAYCGGGTTMGIGVRGRIRKWNLALLAPMIAFPASAMAAPGDMAISSFLAKADALQAKGMMGAFSTDLAALRMEVNGAAQAYRVQLRSEVAQGHPSSCPPLRAPFTSNDVLAQMQTYPAAMRSRTTVATAVADLFRKRYPCHANPAPMPSSQ